MVGWKRATGGEGETWMKESDNKKGATAVATTGRRRRRSNATTRYDEEIQF
jgi:hypothetical protein